MLLAITIKEENPTLEAKREFLKNLLENERLTEELYDDIICKILSETTSKQYIDAGRKLYDEIMFEISKQEIEETEELENLISILQLLNGIEKPRTNLSDLDYIGKANTPNFDYFSIHGIKL